MKKTLPICITLIAASTGWGCKKEPPTQSVKFISEPPGAQLVINGKAMGKTPTTVSLPINDPLGKTECQAALAGYPLTRFELVGSPEFNGVVVLSGSVGFISAWQVPEIRIKFRNPGGPLPKPNSLSPPPLPNPPGTEQPPLPDVSPPPTMPAPEN